MSSEINTQRIKQLLDASSNQLPADTLHSLRTARTRALDHQRIRQQVPVLSWIGHHAGSGHNFHVSKTTGWAIAIIFAAVLFSGISMWQSYSAEHEICDLDVAILTDDLPIHVYVD